MDSPNVVISACNNHTPTKFRAEDDWIEYVDEFVEKSAYTSRAAAIRSLVVQGIRSHALNDPRNKDVISQGSTKPQDSTGHNPATIRELIPEGEENALKIPDEVTGEIESNLLDILYEDPKLTVDGLEVYRDEG